jgi:hypothetical protein
MSLAPRASSRFSARSIIKVGAIVTTLIWGLGVPLFYLLYEHEERTEILEFKAKLAAVAASKYISQHASAEAHTSGTGAP